MKYSTYIVYGIKPKDLRDVPSVEYFKLCKAGGIKQIMRLTHKSPNIARWSKKRKALVEYIDKAVKYCDDKLKEME